jgi:hypothetical protein
MSLGGGGLSLMRPLGGEATPESIAAAGGALTEDLFASALDSRAYSATTTMVLFVAEAAGLVTSAALATSSGGVAQSDASYWSIALTRWRAGVATTIATKTTRTTASGGEAIAGGLQPWTFDAVVFDEAAATLAEGDVVGFVATRVGTPSNINQPNFTVRFEPT